MYISSRQQTNQLLQHTAYLGQGRLAGMGDAELMAATAAGDSAAFDELYRRYRTFIRNFVRRKIQGDETVDDVVQEIFIRLYKSARSFDPSRPLRQWLFTIASNEVRRQWARSGKAARIVATLHVDDGLPEEFESLLADCGPGPYELAVARLLSIQVRRAIDALPEVQRTALLLRTYGGLSLQEIASATHSRVSTVSSRLHYAAEKLRRTLSEGELAFA